MCSDSEDGQPIMTPNTNSHWVAEDTKGSPTITSSFLRNAALAPMVGWGCSCPVFLLIFSEAQAETHWYVLGLLGHTSTQL